MLLLLVPGVGMGAGGEEVPVVVPEPVRPSGGWPRDYDHPRKRTRKDISEARRRLGLEDDLARAEAAAKVVADVAAWQAEALQTDTYKQYEELARQLEVEGLEFEAAYLEALNLERSRLIDAEIGRRLRAIRDDEEVLLMLLMVAASEQ